METYTYTRGGWGEIDQRSLDEAARAAVAALVQAVSDQQRIDEHGSWEFGINTDRRGRGEALNWDLYAVSDDVHSGRLLVVVQVRKAYIGKRFTNVRKSYFLLGTNEDETVFAHPVSSAVLHAAIRAGRDPIQAVQNWMFGGDYARMIRQGDLALLPVSRAVGERTTRRKLELEGSHILTASAIRANGHIYAKNPTLVHIPGTHPMISGDGWYRVIVGKRAPFWPFAAPTAD